MLLRATVIRGELTVAEIIRKMTQNRGLMNELRLYNHGSRPALCRKQHATYPVADTAITTPSVLSLKSGNLRESQFYVLGLSMILSTKEIKQFQRSRV